MTLDAQSLRINPQRAALDLLVHAAETAIVALCAAHPALEQPVPTDPQPSLDHRADQVVQCARLTLAALDRYRDLLAELDRLDHGCWDYDDFLF